MGEDRFEHVARPDDLSGSAVLADLAEPLASFAHILTRLSQTAEYKDHPVLHEFDSVLSRLSYLYRVMVQTH